MNLKRLTPWLLVAALVFCVKLWANPKNELCTILISEWGAPSEMSDPSHIFLRLPKDFPESLQPALRERLIQTYAAILSEQRVERDLSRPIGPVLSDAIGYEKISASEYAISQLLLLEVPLENIRTMVVPLIENTLHNLAKINGEDIEIQQRLWVNFIAARLIGRKDLTEKIVSILALEHRFSSTYVDMLIELNDSKALFEVASEHYDEARNLGIEGNSTLEHYRQSVRAYSLVRGTPFEASAKNELESIAQELTREKFQERVLSTIGPKDPYTEFFHYSQVALEAYIGMGNISYWTRNTEGKLVPRFENEKAKIEIVNAIEAIGIELARQGKAAHLDRFKLYIEAMKSMRQSERIVHVANELEQTEFLWDSRGHSVRRRIWLYDLYRAAKKPVKAHKQIEDLITDFHSIDPSDIYPLAIRTIDLGNEGLHDALFARLNESGKIEQANQFQSAWHRCYPNGVEAQWSTESWKDSEADGTSRIPRIVFRASYPPLGATELRIPREDILPEGLRLAYERIVFPAPPRHPMDRMVRYRDINGLVSIGDEARSQYEDAELASNAGLLRKNNLPYLIAAENAYLAAAGLHRSDPQGGVLK